MRTWWRAPAPDRCGAGTAGPGQSDHYAAQGKQQVGEKYDDRGKEYYERGCTQWAQYVEKAKAWCRRPGKVFALSTGRTRMPTRRAAPSS
jgi:hypothetical protein